VTEISIAKQQPSFFYGYALAGYSFAMGFLASSFFLHSRGIFFPVWMQEFAVDRTEISLVVSLVLFTSSCAAPFVGYLIDKFPLKIIICTGASWMALGYFSLQFVDGYTQFFVTFVLFQGLGWVCVGPLTQTKLMVNWFARNRGLALGIAIMGISVAGVVMPTLAAWLSKTLGWQNSYSLYGAILVLFIVPVTLLVVKQSPAVIGQSPDGDLSSMPQAVVAPLVKQSNFQIYREFLTSKAFWSVVITFGLMNGVYSAMMTHLPNYLTTELRFTLYDASYVLGVAGAFAIVGKIIFGWMMDHIDAKRTVLTAVTSYFCSTLVFISVDNYLLMMFAAALFGLGFGGMVPVRSVLISRLFGVNKFSRVNGLFSFFLAPATFWVLITGYITDTFGSYQYAFQVWAVAFFLAGIITLMVRLPNREDAA
jgi:MFS family permease|tara:strand:- start:8181 stop:9449 length:1269 start_codon:yes stop_codon:yes gene_type:complete